MDTLAPATPAREENKFIPIPMQIVLGLTGALVMDLLAPAVKYLAPYSWKDLKRALDLRDLFFLGEGLKDVGAGIAVCVALLLITVSMEKYLIPVIRGASFILTLVVLGAFHDQLAQWVSPSNKSLSHYVYLACGAIVGLTFLISMKIIQTKRNCSLNKPTI